MHGNNLHAQAVLDLIDALKTGREPELSGRRALQATELIFATYESSRRRGRVDLPLDIDDAPFIAMLNDGDMTTWPDGYVEVDGIRLHYWRTGAGDKPALVLCHGFGDNGLCWTPVARALEADYDIVMVDARGHGLSDAPETGHTTSQRAEDVVGVVKALGLEKPAILGHSMGASTVAAAAAAYPEVFSKVLLEDPGWRAEDSPRAKMSVEEREAWNRQRRENIRRQNQMSRQALMALCSEQRPSWTETEVGNWAVSKQQLSPYVANGGTSRPKPWQEIAAALASPTLLITADVDKGGIVTPELAEAARELNDNIRAVHIVGAGHSIRREAFDTYIAAVKGFLAE
jgi:pimeloyl-ACP methyl ester carboxylesterase